MGRFGYPSLRRQLAGLEPGSRRTVTIFQPVGCISVLRARSLPSSSNSVRSGSSTFSADPLEQVLAQRPQGTQQSLDESVGKLRKGRPPNQVRVRYAMPMSLRARGRAPSL